MDNHNNNYHAEDEIEEFSEEFKCCVCLDLFYKPVVLACGHISCFWCIFEAMDTWQESRCPVCRHSYNHFPSICRLLHFVLLKLYPVAYKRRERQVIEEEKNVGTFSPQFEDILSESYSSIDFNLDKSSLNSTSCPLDKSHLQSYSAVEGELPLLKDSSEAELSDKDHETIFPTSLRDEVPRKVAFQENRILEKNQVNGTCMQMLLIDLMCAICKKLLCRPVVLNCGHVFCEACIINPCDKLCRCPVCQSMHPNGFPKVCLVLEHFLEEYVSEEYAARRVSVPKLGSYENGSTSTCSMQAQGNGSQCSLLPTSDCSSGQGCKVHFGVGCDCCGMYPITGERYTCKDCVEEVGFDLCEGCYNSSSKVPGRFNQQHTPEHKFEIIQPIVFLTVEYSEQSEPYDSDVPVEVSHITDSSSEAPGVPETDLVLRPNDTSDN